MPGRRAPLKFTAIASLVLAAFVCVPVLVARETPFTAWRDTDDAKGVQYRYKVLNADSPHSACDVYFRDTDASKGFTDIQLTYNSSTKGGNDNTSGDRTRIQKSLGIYGHVVIPECAAVSSILITRLERGQ
jgi:hypothetical protein